MDWIAAFKATVIFVLVIGFVVGGIAFVIWSPLSAALVGMVLILGAWWLILYQSIK